jgi:hypothetical protein
MKRNNRNAHYLRNSHIHYYNIKRIIVTIFLLTKRKHQNRWQISKIEQQFLMNGHHPTMFYAIAEEVTSNSTFAMLKLAKIASSNFSAQIVSWKTKNTTTKELLLSKSSRQGCNNGKVLPKMSSSSNKLLTLTILITSL